MKFVIEKLAKNKIFMDTNNSTNPDIMDLQNKFQTSELELKINGFFETDITINTAGKFETKLADKTTFNSLASVISANVNLQNTNQDIILNGYSIKNDRTVKKYLQQNCLIIDENVCLLQRLSTKDNLKLVSILFSGFDLSHACLSAFSLKNIENVEIHNLTQNQKQMIILAYTICCPSIIWIIKNTLLKGLDNDELALFNNTMNIRIKHGGVAIIVDE